MDKRIPLPENQFDCERVRYKHRLIPFSHLITPPPVQYQEFVDMTNANVSKSQSTKFESVEKFFQEI